MRIIEFHWDYWFSLLEQSLKFKLTNFKNESQYIFLWDHIFCINSKKIASRNRFKNRVMRFQKEKNVNLRSQSISCPFINTTPCADVRRVLPHPQLDCVHPPHSCTPLGCAIRVSYTYHRLVLSMQQTRAW